MCVTLTLAGDYANQMVYGNEAKQLVIKLYAQKCVSGTWQKLTKYNKYLTRPVNMRHSVKIHLSHKAPRV